MMRIFILIKENSFPYIIEILLYKTILIISLVLKENGMFSSKRDIFAPEIISRILRCKIDLYFRVRVQL